MNCPDKSREKGVGRDHMVQGKGWKKRRVGVVFSGMGIKGESLPALSARDARQDRTGPRYYEVRVSDGGSWRSIKRVRRPHTGISEETNAGSDRNSNLSFKTARALKTSLAKGQNLAPSLLAGERRMRSVAISGAVSLPPIEPSR